MIYEIRKKKTTSRQYSMTELFHRDKKLLIVEVLQLLDLKALVTKRGLLTQHKIDSGFSDLEDFWDDLLVSRLEVVWKSSGSRLEVVWTS
ncbi:hypothetical protein Bca4012_001582 [Brassica carinata]